MLPKEITWLGEVAADAALRANENGDRAGNDQNRGQFVQKVKFALETIPEDIRGERTRYFLKKYVRGAYSVDK